MNLQIQKLTSRKNLLAFSAGVDSTALFFLLEENKIPFDIVIVNYNVREASKDEVLYAKELAKKFDKKIYIKDITLEGTSNFEKKARDIRYSFFEEIINEHSYETLITAHQLNDKLEWFLMQFSRGAGLNELLSFEEFSKKGNYTIFKPLVNTSKETLIKYLEKNSIKYFVDETNFDEKYKRNYFRKNFSNEFINEFEEGVKRSFNYLENDLNSLMSSFDSVLKEKELEVFKASEDGNINIRTIDKSLKERGFLLSSLQREEILKQKEIVVSHKVSISISKEYIYICPYIQDVTMPKNFKERCRVKKVPKNIRAYVFKEDLFDKLVF